MISLPFPVTSLPVMQLPVAHADTITSGDVISGDAASVDVISGDATSGDSTSGRTCARDYFRHHLTAPPQMISGWCFYTTHFFIVLCNPVIL
jgi:hypothetical protein